MYCKTVSIVTGLIVSSASFAGLEGETFELILEITDSPFYPGGLYQNLGNIVQADGQEWSEIFPVYDYSDPSVPVVGHYEYTLDVGDDYIEMTASWDLISPLYFSLLPGDFFGVHLEFQNATNLSSSQQLQVSSNNNPVQHIGEFVGNLGFSQVLIDWSVDHLVDPHAANRVTVAETTLDVNLQGIGWFGINLISSETLRIDLQFKCNGDTNEDGTVNVADILQLIGAWGPCAGCNEDLNGDGNVNVADLLDLIANWGDCP
jgi:hypothetical protein